jgi:8-oxo-dGTP pyrophosphatase MutT (NUDIX family)
MTSPDQILDIAPDDVPQGAAAASALRARVRPRRAASLVLLRAGRGTLEVLLGRRGGGARFMPGRYVFPGGRASREDSRPWHGEPVAAAGQPSPLLQRLARTALRETFEETGLLLGRRGAAEAGHRRATLWPIEQAYAAHGVQPALDLLTLIGRAITPADSPIRFDARFFLADGSTTAGELAAGEELEDLRWHSVDGAIPGPMSNVTRFMLQRAAAVWRGTAAPDVPFYKHRQHLTIIGRDPHGPERAAVSLPKTGP